MLHTQPSHCTAGKPRRSFIQAVRRPAGPPALRRIVGAFCLALLALQVVAAPAARAAVVRVDLGIFGGRALDVDALVGCSGTHVVAAVEGDAGGYVLDSASTLWSPFFFGRPGQVQEIEVDRTLGGTATNTLFALLQDGRIFTNNSLTSLCFFWPISWGLSTGSGTLSGEFGPTLPGHESGMYLGTASGRIYRSVDGGATWSLLASPGAGNRIRSIAAYVDDPTNPSLWVVVDAGGTPQLLPLTYGGGVYTTGAAIPVTGSGGVFERVFVYPDTTVAGAPLLFVTGDSPSMSLYRGTAGGTSWATTTKSPHYFQQLRFDAANGRIYGASGVSTDLGVTFPSLPDLARPEGNIHPNDGTMMIDPSNPSTVYYASDWFVGEYSIASGSWTAVGELAGNNGVRAILMRDIHQIMDNSTTKDTLIMGGKAGVGITQDFVSRTSAFPTWNFPIYPLDDGAPVSATRLQDYDGDGTVMEQVFVGNLAGQLYRSTTQGLLAADYARVFDVAVDAVGYFDDKDRVEIRDIVEDPSSLDDMYFGFGDWDTGRVGGGVACSTNNGASWAMDPAWVALGDSMKVNALQVTNTKLWIGVGKVDDFDPAHRGLYYKVGSLAGCGTGTFTAAVTGTSLDTAIVHDLAGPTSSPTYIASSAGLFRGELVSGTWYWTDISASLGLPTYTDWKAVTWNPAPAAGCTEEFYGAIADEVYRVRDCGAGYVAALVSPTPFEEVHVLLWDELLAGTSSGFWSLGHASRDLTNCRAAFRSARDKYAKDALKIGMACRERGLDDANSCPDATAEAAMLRSLAKVDLGRKCTDDEVQALQDQWAGTCRGAGSVEDLEECLVDDVAFTIDYFLSGLFGPSGTTTVTGDGRCEQRIGRAYAKVMKSAMRATSQCERKIEKDQEVSCPNDSVAATVERALERAGRIVERSCSSADVVALETRGLPDNCSGVSTSAALHDCLADALEESMQALFDPAETEL